MKASEKITFLLFVFNEERRIEHMLRCLHGNGKIVVIDNDSVDRTREIAKKYTDEIYIHKNPGYIENEETMGFALDKVKTEWVYMAAADELIPRKLMEILHQVVEQDRYKVVRIYRKNFMYGKEIFNYGKHHVRMYRKGIVSYKKNVVHSLGNIDAEKSEIYDVPKGNATSIWHFSSYNTSRLELSHNHYANLEAEQRYKYKGQKFSGARALLKLFYYFFGTYLGMGGFRAGWVGLFISIQIAYFKFSIEARLYEKQNGITLEGMENNYDAMKERLLKAYYDNG